MNKILTDNEKLPHTHTHTYIYIWGGGGPRGIMVKAMDCGIVIREFVFQSRYYVHLGKV